VLKRAFALLGGAVFIASLLFFAVSYAWRFAETGGPWAGVAAKRAALIDILLFSGFALHHSIFARTGVRGWVQRTLPRELERSVYVWISSALFFAVCWWWQPVPGVVWRLSEWPGRAMSIAQLSAGVFTVLAARRLDVLDLAGVRQVLTPSDRHGLDDRGPYRLVRHPIYLGWFGLVWLTPVMNGTRLVFAVISCLYLVLAIPFEERELRRTFGEAYSDYSRRVRWKIVPGIY
jgi:methanethiol S-methyltransferase